MQSYGAAWSINRVSETAAALCSQMTAGNSCKQRSQYGHYPGASAIYDCRLALSKALDALVQQSHIQSATVN